MRWHACATELDTPCCQRMSLLAAIFALGFVIELVAALTLILLVARGLPLGSVAMTASPVSSLP